MRYSGAIVEDAQGRTRYAALALVNRQLHLTIPGTWLAEAEYPVLIDPLIGNPNLISDPRAMQEAVAVAYNPDDGEYLVVWEGYDTGGASLDVQGQRVLRPAVISGRCQTGQWLWPRFLGRSLAPADVCQFYLS